MATLLPDYGGGSIFNLMCSIGQACGMAAPACVPVRGIDVGELSDSRAIVLLVIDGLGYEHVLRGPRDGALRRHLRGSMTSVFPSTTAAAIPTFLTGLAPQQHGLTGWHMYFAEIERILAVLPMLPRDGPALEISPAQLAPRLFDHRPLAAALRRSVFVLSPSEIVASPFNLHHSAGVKAVGFGSVAEMFDRLAELAGTGTDPRYVYAYFPALDSAAHAFGIGSDQVEATRAAIEQGVESLVERLRGSGTVLIVTADHGFIDSPPQRLIQFDDHPELAAMLKRPLCGERRVAYCYVDAQRHSDFEAYVGERLAHAMWLHRSPKLIDEGWFGLGDPNPRLRSRVGDYTLVMREDWTVKDWLPGERRYRQIGVHGGITSAEMRVPLIVART